MAASLRSALKMGLSLLAWPAGPVCPWGSPAGGQPGLPGAVAGRWVWSCGFELPDALPSWGRWP